MSLRFICCPSFYPQSILHLLLVFLSVYTIFYNIFYWNDLHMNFLSLALFLCLSATKYHRRCQYTTCHSFGDTYTAKRRQAKSNAERSKEWEQHRVGTGGGSPVRAGDGVEKAFSFCLQEKLLRNLITLNMKVCEYHVVWRQTVTQYWRAAWIYIWHNIILKMTCVNVSVSTVIYWISIRLSGPRVPKNEKRAPSHRYGVYAHMRTYSAAIHTQIHSIIKIVEL